MAFHYVLLLHNLMIRDASAYHCGRGLVLFGSRHCGIFCVLFPTLSLSPMTVPETRASLSVFALVCRSPQKEILIFGKLLLTF